MDHRSDPGIQHRRVCRSRLLSHTGAAGGQRREAQQHEGADDLTFDLGARAGRVAADQAGLQLGAKGDGDMPGGQRAEAGRDAIVGLDVPRQVFNNLATLADLPDRVGGDFHAGSAAGNSHHVLERQRADADGDGAGVSGRRARQEMG